MKTVLMSSFFLSLGWASVSVSGPLRSLEVQFHVDVQEVHPSITKVNPESGQTEIKTDVRPSERNVQGVYTSVLHDEINPSMLVLRGECVRMGHDYYQTCYAPTTIRIKFGSVEDAHQSKERFESLNEKQKLTLLYKPIIETIIREAREPDPGFYDPGESVFSEGYSEQHSWSESVTFDGRNILNSNLFDGKTGSVVPYQL